MRRFFLFYALISLISCVSKKRDDNPFKELIGGMKSQVSTAIELPVRKDSLVTIPFVEELSPIHFKDVYFTKLTTPEDELIGKIDKVIVFKENLYILDSKSNAIYVMSAEGAYIRRIQRLGRGPGEYIKLSDFAILEAREELVVFSVSGRKLIHYDLEGNLIKELRTPYWMREFAVVDSDHYYFVTEGKNHTGYHLLVLDSMGGAVKKALPSETPNNRFNLYGASMITKSQNHTWMLMPLSNNIYELSEDGINLRYSLKIENHEFDHDQVDFENRIQMTEDFNNHNDKYLLTGQYFVTDKLVSFGINKSQSNARILVYSKKSKSTKQCQLWLLEDELYLNAPFFLNNKLVSIMPANWLVKNKTELAKKYDVGDLFDGLNNMSNDVLVSYSIEDF